MRDRTPALILAAAAWGCADPADTGTDAARYDIVDLGTLGGDAAGATAINGSGVIVGWSEMAPYQTGTFRYTEGVIEDVGSAHPEATLSLATAIDDTGRIVGSMTTTVDGGEAGPVTVLHAFVLDDQGALVDLFPGDLDSSTAEGINASGHVVGTSYSAGAFTWTADGGLLPLGTLPDGPTFPPPMAMGIGDDGTVVGSAKDALDHDVPFTWTATGGFTVLPTLGGPHGVARAIGPDGWIVGGATTGSGVHHPTLWRDGVAEDLGLLPERIDGFARAINADGVIVGVDAGDGWDAPLTTPWIWEDGEKVALGDLLDGDDWTLKEVAGIDDAGRIVGTGRYLDHHTRAFLMTPRPAAGR